MRNISLMMMMTVLISSLAGCTGDDDGDGVLVPVEVLGCTDSTADNFDADATDDDGSCEFDSVITAGLNHTCTILDNGSVSCWGKNRNGQLGDGTDLHQLTPTPTSILGENRTAVAISTGGSHTCAILDDGSVSCWGKNYFGQLGDGTGDDRFTPTQTSSLGGNRTAVAISAGGSHTCAILDDGSVSCWGYNYYGQLGFSADASTPTPTSSLGENRTAVAISTGGSHTCAILDDGSVSCWGMNNDGQIGDGTTSDRDTPTQTSSLGENRTAVAISAGGSHTCAILDDGSVSCWGANLRGQLGDGTNSDRDAPTQTDGLDNLSFPGDNLTAIAISAGGAHTCAILNNGSSDRGVGYTSCWGNNIYGQLCDGINIDTNKPSRTALSFRGPLSAAVAIATGGGHTCAMVADGSTYCWGYNYFGQLGDGTTTDRNYPY
jgi:alpha-tubulin suppressor-like RCC1 family protein